MIYEPKKPGPRARRRERQRQDIKTAALVIIARGGLEALTMQSLAAATDFTPGALYRYFVSKMDLIFELERESLELLAHYLAQSRDWVDSWQSLEGEDKLEPKAQALAQLLAVNAVHCTLPTAIPERFTLLSAILGHTTPLVTEEEARPHIKALATLIGGIAERFSHASSIGALEVGNDLERAFVFVAAVQGIFPFRRFAKVAPQFAANEDRARRVAMALLRGWGASPDLALAERALALRLKDQHIIAVLEDQDVPKEEA